MGVKSGGIEPIKRRRLISLGDDAPSLRDLVSAELNAVEAKVNHAIDVMDERDRLYKERDDSRRTAVDAALTAVKEQTAAAFISSEKAIVKAEEAQKAYNQSHNDLARKMDEQNKATMPRSETEQRFRGVDEKISEIREQMSGTSGAGHGASASKQDARANTAMVVGMIGVVMSFVVMLILLYRVFTGH